MPEARILLRTQSNGKVEISVLDPVSGKESRTGLKVARNDLDRHIRAIKEQFQKSGTHFLGVKEM